MDDVLVRSPPPPPHTPASAAKMPVPVRYQVWKKKPREMISSHKTVRAAYRMARQTGESWEIWQFPPRRRGSFVLALNAGARARLRGPLAQEAKKW